MQAEQARTYEISLVSPVGVSTRQGPGPSAVNPGRPSPTTVRIVPARTMHDFCVVPVFPKDSPEGANEWLG